MECKLEDFNNCSGEAVAEFLKENPLTIEDHPEAPEDPENNWRMPFACWSNDYCTLVVSIDDQGSGCIESVLNYTQNLLELVAKFRPDEYETAQVGTKTYHRLWWD